MNIKYRHTVVIFTLFVLSACSTMPQPVPEPPPVPVPVPSPPPPPPAPAPTADSYFPPGTPEFHLQDGPTSNDVDYPIWFGTTRRTLSDAAGRIVGFSDRRDAAIHYGRVFVTIPKGHKTGSIGGGSHRPGIDPPLKVRDITLEENEARFIALARAQLSEVTGPANNYLVIFIHGYNNSFTDAALRAAQLGQDLDVPKNHMMMFSWAANSKLIRYTYDEATVDTSERYFRDFLISAGKIADGRKIHVIAHSMGNRALLRVIAAGIRETTEQDNLHFGQIILAAADVDKDLFMQLAPSYLKAADRTTVYISPYDYAVAASWHIHDYPRIGCGTAPHLNIKGIDNIVSTIPSDFPGHAYFAETLPILTDIKNLILRNEPARTGGTWQQTNGYWIVGPAIIPRKVRCITPDATADVMP